MLIAAGLGSALISGSAAANLPPLDPVRPVAFICSVSGAKRLNPTDVCALFKRRLDARLSRPSIAAQGWPKAGNVVQISVRFVSSREVSAIATMRSDGRTGSVPEITQDFMDKPAGLRDLDLLATQLTSAIVR